MKPWLLLVSLSFVGVSYAQPDPAGFDASADEVSIRSAWAGLSPDSPLITELVFKRSDVGYMMTGTNSRADEERGQVHFPYQTRLINLPCDQRELTTRNRCAALLIQRSACAVADLGPTYAVG